MDDVETLYRQYAPAVLRFAWGLCGDRAQAEDLVAETFVRAITRAPRIQARTALAYLLAIARNAYLSGQRRRWREVPLPDVIRAPDDDPEGRLDDEVRLKAVLDLVHQLP